MATRLENNAEPLPGYRLLERLGGGGFGEVWKCIAPGGLHKAIKFVYGTIATPSDEPGTGPPGGAEDDWAVSREDEGRQARQEYKALERVKNVRHPYILTIERYDIIAGQLLIVMELADRNLWDRFKECRAQGLPGVPRDELLGYLEEAAEALDLMNGEYQLQHLDIKPQNLFLVHNHIKVADFGLVKFLEGLETKVTGGITPVYAAPETFDGIVSRQCDQYSLAICYQELLTGQRPFAGASIRQLVLQHLQAQPNVASLPVGDRPIILRALAKTPGDRYPTCREMMRLLRQTTVAPGDAPGEQLPVNATSDSAIATPAPTAFLRRPSDSAQGVTQPMRPGDASVLLPSAARRAPAEVKGDGALYPALIVGLGQLGLGILRSLRERLVESFGGLDAVPHLKLLLLDTDPEVMRAATQGKQGSALAAGEVQLAPLNRPSHYLKPRDGQPNLADWLPQQMLYRIPRSQVTTGVRALGRLAFADNYRSILRRLQLDLDAIHEPAALQHAARTTGLGVRTNRPRIYLLTSLAGGTGSGLFLDLAYSLRALLKQHGYEQPDIVGVLLVPAADATHARPMHLGNAFAALTELRYYATPGTTFEGRYHERETPIRDTEPPFTRTVVLQLPEEANEPATRELLASAGQLLFRDLCSPLGRTADLARADLPGPAWPERGLYCQSFGLYRLSWPRRQLVEQAAHNLCLQLLARWMSKDSKPLLADAASYVKERWRKDRLAPDVYLDALQDQLQKTLRKDPETALLAVVEPLVRQVRAQAASTPPTRRWGQAVPAPLAVPAADLQAALAEIERLVGKPCAETLHETTGELGAHLRRLGEELTNQWSQKLAEATVCLLEEPQYRLAGAEEAVRQIVQLLDQVLLQYEPLCKEVDTRTANGYETLQTLLDGKLHLTCDEVVELLRLYPKTRLQSLLLHQVTQAFLVLRGHMSDQLREINFCRTRLSELQRDFEAQATPLPLSPSRQGQPPAAPRTGAGRVLLPAGCSTLTEAVDRLLAAVDAPRLLELDTQMETMIRHNFQALVNICLTHANILKDVERAMLETAGQFVGGLLDERSVAEMFLEQIPDPEQRKAELLRCDDAAEPGLHSGPFAHRDGHRSFHGEIPLRQLRILARPAGPAGEELLHLLRDALDGLEVEGALSSTDVLLYRELVNLHLAHLEQLGAAGLDAYRRMSATENFTPHARADVDFGAMTAH